MTKSILKKKIFKDHPDAESLSLLYTEMKIIDNNRCDEFEVSISEYHICALAFDEKTPSQGDSGGPLILKSSMNCNSPILIGITIFTGKDNLPTTPTIFIRIASYVKWIKEKTGVFYQKKRKRKGYHV